MAWEVEFITETFYTVKQYSTRQQADAAADRFLRDNHPSVDPKTWVRPAR